MKRLYDWLLAKAALPRARHWLYGVSFTESIFFPIPPDVLLAPITLARPTEWQRLALMTTAFSALGGLVGYGLGYVAFQWLEPYLQLWGHYENYLRISAWLERYGIIMVLLAGFTPLPYKIFAITAGAMSLNLIVFILFSCIGRGARFALVAKTVSWQGKAIMDKLYDYLNWIGWGLIALFAAFLIYQY